MTHQRPVGEKGRGNRLVTEPLLVLFVVAKRSRVSEVSESHDPVVSRLARTSASSSRTTMYSLVDFAWGLYTTMVVCGAMMEEYRRCG